MDSLSPEPTSVYKYYDKSNILLYVGITKRGSRRQREHNVDKEWWPFVARQDVEHFATRAAALNRESALIQKYRSPFNRQHNPDHAEMRTLYLLHVALPDAEQTTTLGPPASRKARQLVSLLGHRVPLVKVSQSGRTVTYATRARHAELAKAVNHGTKLPLLHSKKIAEMQSARIDGKSVLLTFHGYSELPKLPADAFLKIRCTKNPYTIWAYQAVAA
jgi:predicted GIY-YIG superfamily endonuclease